MKQSNIIISVIIVVGVLITALAVGLYIRDTRQNISNQSETIDKPTIQKNNITAKNFQKVEEEQKPRNLSPEQHDQIKEQIQTIKQQWVNMSEQEKKEFRAKLLETFDTRRQDTERNVQTSPDDVKDEFSKEFLEIKGKWEGMTEQERQQFMEKIRESANAIRQGND